MAEFKFYNDRMSALNLPKDLRNYFESLGLIANDGLQMVSFCGLVANKDNINIFLPRSVSESDILPEHRQKIASHLLQSIDRYGRVSKTSIKASDDGDGGKGLEQLSLMLSLLDDYQNYGLYSRRQILHTKNTGRVNWHKTISKNLPYPDSRGDPIYVNLVGQRSRYLTNTEVSRIHADIIRKISKKYGWIVNEHIFLFEQELKDIPFPLGTDDFQLSVIRKELNQTYSDRDIQLLQNLINYLESKGGDNQSNFIAGLTRFHHAWEHMLHEIFENTIKINNQLPAPVYIYENDMPQTAFEHGMRTDIVLEDKINETITIVDAKYYAATNVGNAPSWSDIVKQFFYAEAMVEIFPEHTILNIFIFPGKEQIFKQIKMRTRHPTEVYLDDKFPPVRCVYVCPLRIVSLFYHRQKINILDLIKV